MYNQLNHTDDVSGIVIGDIQFNGQLHYDGRPQGPTIWATDDNDMQQQADAILARIKEDCGTVFDAIYPINDWKLRSYKNGIELGQ